MIKLQLACKLINTMHRLLRRHWLQWREIFAGHAIFRPNDGERHMGGKRLRVLFARIAQFQIKLHVHHRAAETTRAGRQAEGNIKFALRKGTILFTLRKLPLSITTIRHSRFFSIRANYECVSLSNSRKRG